MRIDGTALLDIKGSEKNRPSTSVPAQSHWNVPLSYESVMVSVKDTGTVVDTNPHCLNQPLVESRLPFSFITKFCQLLPPLDCEVPLNVRAPLNLPAVTTLPLLSTARSTTS